jgi:hypothetical protein
MTPVRTSVWCERTAESFCSFSESWASCNEIEPLPVHNGVDLRYDANQYAYPQKCVVRSRLEAGRFAIRAPGRHTRALRVRTACPPFGLPVVLFVLNSDRVARQSTDTATRSGPLSAAESAVTVQCTH